MTIRPNLERHGLLMTLAGAALALTACGANDSAEYGYLPSPSGADNSGDAYYNNSTNNSGDAYDNSTNNDPSDEDPITENDFIDSSEENVSTFSIDVDNASYTVMRRDIQSGYLPSPSSVRPEEYINFFDYGYAPPVEDPFSINLEVAPSAFGDDLHMVRVGLQGIEVPIAKMKPTNLVFLIDTSGSMSGPQKLPMVKRSLSTLLDNLRPSDTVGIVTYAGSAGTLLAPTPVSQKQTIVDAVDRLGAGGSTAGEAGIVEAYRLAESA